MSLSRKFLTAGRSYAQLAVHGQPHYQSHPHLLNSTQLTPGIPPSDYEQRRKALMDSLPHNAIVVSVAAPVKFMSQNIFYKYRQASNFWYLTAFEEPESAVILQKKPSAKRGYEMTLFCRGKDSDKEKWDGPRTSFESATQLFASDATFPITDFYNHLRSLISSRSSSAKHQIYIDLPPSTSYSSTSKKFMKLLTESPSIYSDPKLDVHPKPLIHALAPHIAPFRAIKSPAEQKVMREAADISGRAHAKVMRYTTKALREPNATSVPEQNIQAHFEYLCTLAGSQRPAYVPVVASGSNALVIHYTANNQLIRPGDMVLVDAGCEYNGYASDITRTYPASGKFTGPQRHLYCAVLSAQKSLIAACSASPSSLLDMIDPSKSYPTKHKSLHELHTLSCTLLRRELNQIGFSISSDRELEILYPHYLSHPIGIDLHESDHFDRSAPLKPGMVVTIEPGVYVPPLSQFPQHYHNIGIRIEDQVLITDGEPIVLSVNAPKEIKDVEGACQGLLGLEPF